MDAMCQITAVIRLGQIKLTHLNFSPKLENGNDSVATWVGSGSQQMWRAAAESLQSFFCGAQRHDSG